VRVKKAQDGVEVLLNDGDVINLSAAEVDQLTVEVVATPTCQFAVVGDQHRLFLIGVDRDSVVIGARHRGLGNCPADVTCLDEHAAHPRVDALVQDEAHYRAMAGFSRTD
jgi:hypothetical protein